DVVELDLLRVQGPATGLDVVLHHLAARVGAVALAHRARPDAAGDAADHGVFRVHALAEEERQGGGQVGDFPPAGGGVYSWRVKPLDRVKASWLIGFAPASAMWYPLMLTE